jgi:hypothetical protein
MSKIPSMALQREAADESSRQPSELEPIAGAGA